jgi:hypothetical protein
MSLKETKTPKEIIVNAHSKTLFPGKYNGVFTPTPKKLNMCFQRF